MASEMSRYWCHIDSGRIVRAERCPALSGWIETQTCQNGDAMICLAGNRCAQGVVCPEASCDIDDGIRPMPPGIDDAPSIIEQEKTHGS